MENLTPELLDKVYGCIKKMQERGQVVALDSLEVMMEREHGALLRFFRHKGEAIVYA